MTEFGEHRIEHHPAERIVLDAENAQAPPLSRRRNGIGIRTGGLRRPGADQGDAQGEGGAAAAPRRHFDVAAHRPRQRLHRGKPEAGAAEARGDRDIGLRERTKQPLDLVQRQTDSAVGNRKGDTDLAPRPAHRPDRERDAAGFGELHGIVDQVFQRRTQADGIADHEGRKLFGNVDVRLQALGGRPAGQQIADAAGERAQIEKILPNAKPGDPASRRVDKQCREAGKVFGAGLDGIDPAPFALVEVGGCQQIADGENPGQRRADLVRERGERHLDHAGHGGRGSAFARLAAGNF